MNEKQIMQHELKCRAQIIEDLQTERERIMEMVNRANAACHRLRDEVVYVTAQTHGIIKAVMFITANQEIHLPGNLLKKMRGYQLEKGKKLDDDDEGSLRFTMREHTPTEVAREKQLRAKIEGASKRIKS